MRRCIDVALCVFMVLLATSGWAQGTAEITGVVRDNSGGVLPGVTVTMTQTDTGFTRTVVTNEDGAYSMPNLATGPYRLEAQLQGFRTFSRTGIVLQVGASPVLNVELAIGGLEESVTVEAATPLVDVRSAGVSEVVEQERIVELPLQGRQVTDLIVLAGAAVNTGPVTNTRGRSDSVAISVAGGLRTGVTYTLDGALHNDVYDNGNLAFPFPDALQEFQVATGGLSAESGMHSGASVNAVTRSGTNRFSGSAFEFARHHRFNATSPFAAVGPDGERASDGLVRNQFGGTFGGPIIRDKLFFFGGYPGHVGGTGDGRQHRVGADRRDAGRRLHRTRVARLQCRPPDRASRPVREQQSRSLAGEPDFEGHLHVPAHPDQWLRRDPLHGAGQQEQPAGRRQDRLPAQSEPDPLRAVPGHRGEHAVDL